MSEEKDSAWELDDPIFFPTTNIYARIWKSDNKTEIKDWESPSRLAERNGEVNC